MSNNTRTIEIRKGVWAYCLSQHNGQVIRLLGPEADSSDGALQAYLKQLVEEAVEVPFEGEATCELDPKKPAAGAYLVAGRVRRLSKPHMNRKSLAKLLGVTQQKVAKTPKKRVI